MGLTGLDADGFSRGGISEVELLAATAIDALLALRVVATQGARTDEERSLLVSVAREAGELERFLSAEPNAASRPSTPHLPAIEIAS